jgi:hypothetical protein
MMARESEQKNNYWFFYDLPEFIKKMLTLGGLLNTIPHRIRKNQASILP